MVLPALTLFMLPSQLPLSVLSLPMISHRFSIINTIGYIYVIISAVGAGLKVLEEQGGYVYEAASTIAATTPTVSDIAEKVLESNGVASSTDFVEVVVSIVVAKVVVANVGKIQEEDVVVVGVEVAISVAGASVSIANSKAKVLHL